jgi:hypothetical protein
VPDDIPDQEDVSRHLFAPSMGEWGSDLIWHVVFMFKTERNYCESVVWRRYASTLADVHKLGCDKQRVDRADGKSSTYFGAITGNVGRIRGIRSKNGARFQIVHAPEEGIHHAHISYAGDVSPSKNDKAELKSKIRREFPDRSEHVCIEEE